MAGIVERCLHHQLPFYLVHCRERALYFCFDSPLPHIAECNQRKKMGKKGVMYSEVHLSFKFFFFLPFFFLFPLRALSPSLSLRTSQSLSPIPLLIPYSCTFALRAGRTFQATSRKDKTKKQKKVNDIFFVLIPHPIQYTPPSYVNYPLVIIFFFFLLPPYNQGAR